MRYTAYDFEFDSGAGTIRQVVGPKRTVMKSVTVPNHVKDKLVDVAISLTVSMHQDERSRRVMEPALAHVLETYLHYWSEVNPGAYADDFLRSGLVDSLRQSQREQPKRPTQTQPNPEAARTGADDGMPSAYMRELTSGEEWPIDAGVSGDASGHDGKDSLIKRDSDS